MIDVTIPNSPGWWLDRCAKKLRSRQPRLERLNRYRVGDPPLPEGAANARTAYQAFQRKSRLHLADLIVSSLRERQQVRAIRTGVDPGDDGDPVAWAVYRHNSLDVELADTLDLMLGLGDAYMITSLVEGEQFPAITGEDPRQVVTIHDPVRQANIRAAAKFFHDPDQELDLGYLFVHGRRFVASRASRSGRVWFNARAWDWHEPAGGADGQPTMGIQPVVRFRNRHGVSEFEPHIDVLDRINHMILQRMVIATMQAFRQRAVIGDLPTHYPPGHARAGEEIDYDGLFVADPGALWMIPGAAEMWESGQVDIQGILSAVKDDVRNLAAVTRRPLPVMDPDAANQSAEGASLTREGLTFAVEDRNRRAGQALARVMSNALTMMGETDRARVGGIDVEWFPAERHSLASRGSAAQQARAAGVPWRFIMEQVWQATPEQIRRAEADRFDDMMTAAAAAFEVAGGPA